MQSQINTFTRIFHIKPVPPCFSGSVNRKRFIQQGTGNKTGNDLFQMLIRAILIEQTQDHHWDIISTPITVNKAVSPGLGRCIRIHGIHGMVLSHWLSNSSAIDLGGGNMDKPLNPGLIF